MLAEKEKLSFPGAEWDLVTLYQGGFGWQVVGWQRPDPVCDGGRGEPAQGHGTELLFTPKTCSPVPRL